MLHSYTQFFKLKYIKNINLVELDGILVSKKFDDVTKKVINFYNENPFPNYDKSDNKNTILAQGDNSYLKSLKRLLGFNKKILEVGCGTGQYSNYFAIGTNNHIFALDPTYKSLQLAKNFSDKNNIKNIKYINGSIFEDLFEKESFDLVFCSGVLHHTKDTYLGLEKCTELVKKNGYILIGLYNSYSRFPFKKIIYKLFGKKVVSYFDPILRDSKFSKESINAWIEDQYNHPVERSHTIQELLNWFKKCNIEPLTGIPDINSVKFDKINEQINKKDLFESKSRLTLIFNQLMMNFNLLGKDGSLFCILGKKL